MSRCEYIFKQGQNEGKRCRMKQLENNNHCFKHSEHKKHYNRIVNAEKKHINLEKKFTEMITENRRILDFLLVEYVILNRELCGVKLFIDPDSVSEDSKYYEQHVPYNGTHTHNALRHKKVLKKKIKAVKETMEKVSERIKAIEKAQKYI